MTPPSTPNASAAQPSTPVATSDTASSARGRNTAARPGGARTRRGRWVPWLGGVLLLAFIVFGFWPKPVPVEIGKVIQGPLRSSVSEEGRTRIRQRYVISSPVAGHLRRVPFKAGDPITTNQVVAVIDPITPPLLDARSRTLSEARRATAQAQLEKAKSAHFFARKDLERSETLHKDNALSAQALEQAQWKETAAARELAVAESALRQAEAELAVFTNASENGLGPVELRSPISGRVLRVIEESSRVLPLGAPIAELGDPSDLEAVIEVLSRDGTSLQAGMKAELEHWGGSSPLKARVRLVEPAAFTKVSALGVEEQRVNVIVDLLTPPAERGQLGDQFRVEGRVITWETDRALKLPSGALFRRGDQWAVFVMDNGVARTQIIQIGRQSGTEAQVLSGLQEGQEIVLYPSDRVQDGRRIKRISL